MSLRKIISFIVLTKIMLISCACTQDLSSTSDNMLVESSPTSVLLIPTAQQTTVEPAQASPSTGQISEIHLGFTYQQANGNRIVPGETNFETFSRTDYQIPGIPTWVVGTPFQEGIVWSISLENGQIITKFTSKEGMSDFPNPVTSILPGAPIHSLATKDTHRLVTVSDSGESQLTHPVFLPNLNLVAYISQNGSLNFTDSSNQLITSLPVNALPDARILVDDQERLLLLTDPTDEYTHGVLGDGIEAKSIKLVETSPSIRIASTVNLEIDEVIEGIAPIWVDITGDGEQEIIVTVSDFRLGAGVVVFDEEGRRIAMGPKIGQPFRWRHQIAYAQTGPAGKSEIIVVRTPHIGGVIEYYQFTEGTLELSAEFPGITSHVIGSRNLDMSAVVDLNRDGAQEVLVLSPQLDELIAVQRSQTGAEEFWRAPLGGRISTNIVGAQSTDGQLSIALGTDDGYFRIWTSE